jgi:O-antigen/teichoic acid export membrane protein
MDRKFTTDLIWNYGSLAILAVSGFVLNFLVGAVYGAEGLGVFNQVYAVYVILSQLAVGGIHYSALRHAAMEAEGSPALPRILWSAALLVLGLSGLVAAGVFLLAEPLARMFSSPEVAVGIRWIAPALVLFSLNKVLLGMANGRRMMRLFAVGQSLRVLTIILAAAGIAWLDGSAAEVSICFLAAEAALALLLLPVLLRHVGLGDGAGWRQETRRHAVFGFRGFMSGMVIEANTRIDVVLLGLFLDDRAVGVYSFAAVIAEGFINLLVVVRNNVNPILVRLLAENRVTELRQFVRRLQRLLYPGTAACAAVGLLLYRPVVALVLGEDSPFLDSLTPLALLLGGMVLASGYIPFDQIFLQAGRPATYTAQLMLGMFSNIAFNLALIPVFGIAGSALGTALSLLVGAVVLNVMSVKLLGFTLGLPAGRREG